jgi:hypothetical protein
MLLQDQHQAIIEEFTLYKKKLLQAENRSQCVKRMRQKISEQHHWWPKGVSAGWADKGGGVHWLLPTGEVRKARPKSFGVIGNGHSVRLDDTAGVQSQWDRNFENEFAKVDSNFPAVIKGLECLSFDSRVGYPLRSRFVPQPDSDDLFGQTIEALISLAIRSPMTREAFVSWPELIRGPLSERERNKLIASNMQGKHRLAMEAVGSHGKLTAIYSPDREFIFGDGFYHSFTSPNTFGHFPKILAPLTPRLAVLFALPNQYARQPRLSTLVIARDEAEDINRLVQIYARNMIFYREDKPEILDVYRMSKHLMIASSDNIVEILIHNMPGVPEHDTSLDFLNKFPGNSQ